MRIAENWLVIGSFDKLSAYVESKGGRIPTEPELRLFLDKFNVGYEEGANVGFRSWYRARRCFGLCFACLPLLTDEQSYCRMTPWWRTWI